MKLNSERLILRDIFSYDIEACHYNLMKKFGYDTSNIPKHDKVERNIMIGKMMRDDEQLKTRLRETTAKIIDDYIELNELDEKDIIIRQYDGIITKKRLIETTQSVLPIALQNRYDILLVSIDRGKYIGFDNMKGLVKVKGVPSMYSGIKEYHKKLIRIVDIENRSRILAKLEELKQSLMNEADLHVFAIPVNDEEVEMIFKSFGQITVKRNTLYYMSDDEIDKEFYYDYYLNYFVQSVLLEILS